MARSFLVPINLNNLELQNFRVHNVDQDPTGSEGRLYYNSTSKALKFYNGTSWLTVATGGSTFTLGSTSVSIGGTTTTVQGLTLGSSSVWNGNTIGVAYGGTGTATGSITGTGALTFTAGGSNNNVNLRPTGTGSVDLGSTNGTDGFRLTGLKDPSGDYDAVNKKYVDSVAAGLNAHPAVNYATTGALGTTGNLVGGTITTTYSNGTNGDGATLTIATSSNWTAITIDGQSLTVTDRVLIKNQASSLQNGIYTVTSVGAVGNTTSFVFTRATDSNSTPEVAAGDTTYVLAGTINAGNGFVQTAVVTTIGTSAISWSQFSGSSTVLAGDGLQPDSTNPNQLDVVGTADRITVGANSVDIASTYVGQTSITTLGTIGTGTWQGTAIAGQYGGTGVNNSGKTITLGGNLTTSGAFATTLTVTNTTSVTLPTSGTLMDNKMTTIGDILYASATGTPATYTRLAGNTATQPSFLSSTGNGSANTTTAFTSSTGSNNVVLSTSPTIATPTLTGTVTAATITAASAQSMALRTLDQSGTGTLTTGITIKSGDQTSAVSNASNNSGSITIDAGTAGTGGTVGSILIGNTNATTITVGKSDNTTTTNLRGTVQISGKSLSLSGNTTIGSSTHTVAFVTSGNTSVTLPTSGTLLTTAGSGSSLTFGTGSLSLAGNLTTSGAFAITLTATNTTTLTLPTTGTLATLAGSEALTNKTYNGLTITANGTNTLNIAAGKTLAVNKSITLDGTDSTTMTFPSTSATIARTDAGQTFTGVNTFTSPSITTSLTTGSTTFALLDSTATTITFGGAATTFTIGGAAGATTNLATGTGASTLNLGTGANSSTGTTKTINIGATTVGTAATQTINIGEVATNSGSSNVNIGGSSGTTTTTVTGVVKLPTVGTSGFVKLGSGGALSADTTTYARKATQVGAGSGTTISWTNTWSTNLVTAQVYDTSTSTATLVECDITATTSAVVATFANSVTLSNYTLVITG